MAHDLRAEFLGEMRGGLSQSALVEIGKHEPGAVLCQPLGDRKTDAFRRTSDDSNIISEFFVHVRHFFRE